jgi:hypothetical protein
LPVGPSISYCAIVLCVSPGIAHGCYATHAAAFTERRCVVAVLFQALSPSLSRVVLSCRRWKSYCRCFFWYLGLRLSRNVIQTRSYKVQNRTHTERERECVCVCVCEPRDC